MRILEWIFRAIMAVILCIFAPFLIYVIFWSLFAFGTSVYDSVTDSNDGWDTYWNSF